ncbi:MAG: NAD(P)H-hydrate dehydratase [Firmicutes bacterium]|nr:NAD(P)H-hydrate dehydratase [Bacillota bacterium]
MQVFDGAEMSAMDRWTIEVQGVPGIELMERAAEGVVEAVLRQDCARVIFVCGMGNNGGDGFAAARLLCRQGRTVEVFTVGNPGGLKGDARINYERLEGLAVTVKPFSPAYEAGPQDLVVDALFGTGLARPVEGVYAEAVEWINRQPARVIAVDIPSGVHAGTGQVMGCAVRATETVTISRHKTGLWLYPGRDLAGRVTLATIGVDSPNPVELAGCKMVTDAAFAAEMMVPRLLAGHKGTYGQAGIMAGSPGMMGAAIFAVRSAYQSGAGLVRCLIPASESTAMTVSVPEAVQKHWNPNMPQLLEMPPATAYLIGPGLGRCREAFIRALSRIPDDKPLVLDADGLNMLAESPELARPGMILTPHMGEAARLSGRSIAELYRNMPEAAIELARRYQSVVVLKNASTVVAAPDGRIAVNPTGNPGMSTAGAGDVLAGLIVGWWAQDPGADPFKLAAAAVWMHGAAGDRAAAVKGQYALMASDILEYLRPDQLIDCL